jgi:hypothetical protein
MSNTALLEGDRVKATTSSPEVSRSAMPALLVGFIFEKISSLNSYAMQKALRAQTED